MLINISHCKQFALEASAGRAHKFTRVSREYLEDLDSRVRELIRKDLRGLPSVGKTIYPAVRAHKKEDGA